MKRLNLFLLIGLIFVGTAMAVPAKKGNVKVVQPDGTVLTIALHGDEWLHFNTTSDGYSVVKNDHGYFVYAQLKDGELVPTAQVAHDGAMRSDDELTFLQGVKKMQTPQIPEQVAKTKQAVQERQRKALAAHKEEQYDYSNFRGLVILVQFNDKQFSRSDYKEIITDMVNKEGYTGFRQTNGRTAVYTGSVRDYFSDNSAGKFQPQFDVVGPVTINYSQYAAHGSANAASLIYAAVNALDAEIDFSQYDRDGDGVVDMIYFIFAGNGSNYSGNDSRLYWPHRSIIYNPSTYQWVVKDGVYLYDYASSVELAGWTDTPSTVMIDGIGTICHEFSHVLGLPDFYDADYEASGGESNHPGIWSLMAGGSYENDSRTPVGYSLYERYAVGFAEPEQIEDEGSYQLEQIGSSNTGFRINTPVNGEYFLLENRQPSRFKWDAYMPGSGMLVFRVDRTNTRIWDNNQVNNNPSHNYYELLRAGGGSAGDKGENGAATDPFPGGNNVTELHNGTSPASLKTWAGKNTQWGLTEIKETDGVISFEVVNTYVLKSLTLPETEEVGVGLVRQLIAEANPDYAIYTLTWESSNPEVATVDENGLVTGVAAGNSVITVRSENGCTASCTVVVAEERSYSIGEFKEQAQGDSHLLIFNDAEVLYVAGNNIYVRDASGSIILSNLGFSLQKNDVLNGTICAEVSTDRNMPVAASISGVTNADFLVMTSGNDVLPKLLTLDELDASLYADYVELKDVQILRDGTALELFRGGGYYVVSENSRVRVNNTFSIPDISLSKDMDGKYYNLKAIFGTNVLSDNIIDELYLLENPVEAEHEDVTNAIGSIEVIKIESVVDTACYNLNGQRVGSSYKGIVVKNGRKYIQR